MTAAGREEKKERLQTLGLGVLAAGFMLACILTAVSVFQSLGGTRTAARIPSGTGRIFICIGDQHSMEKKDASDWPSLLQTLLLFKYEQNAPKVLNLSRPGANTVQNLELLKKTLNPDSRNITVLVMTGANNYWNRSGRAQESGTIKKLFRLLTQPEHTNAPLTGAPETGSQSVFNNEPSLPDAAECIRQAQKNEQLRDWQKVLFYRYRLRDLDRESAENLYAIGNAHLRLNQSGPAQERFKNGRSKYPEKSSFAFGLGHIALNESRYSEAQKFFELAKTLEPPFAPELSLFLARALRAQGKPEKAVDEIRSRLKTDPKDKELRTELGLCLADEGKNTDALRVFADCAKDFPADIIFYERCAWLCILDSRYTQAGDWIEKGLRISPQNTALLKTGKILKRLETGTGQAQEKENVFPVSTTKPQKSGTRPAQTKKTYIRTPKSRTCDNQTIDELAQIISLCRSRKAQICFVRYPFETRPNPLMHSAAQQAQIDFIAPRIEQTDSRPQRAAALAAAVFRHSQNDAK